jgi:hypothetical protein
LQVIIVGIEVQQAVPAEIEKNDGFFVSGAGFEGKVYDLRRLAFTQFANGRVISTRLTLVSLSGMKFPIFDEVLTFTLWTRPYQSHTPKRYNMPLTS